MTSFAFNFSRASHDSVRQASVLERYQAANDGPQFDIVRKGQDEFAVVVAVPGFTIDELDISATEGSLTVVGRPGRQGAEQPEGGAAFKRPFTRRFKLAEHMQVADAALADGLLRVGLERRVPETKKPRSIAINAAKAA